MITLDNESAAWAKHATETNARKLRTEARRLRSMGDRHVLIRRAANHVCDALERAARELEGAAAAVNNNTPEVAP